MSKFKRLSKLIQMEIRNEQLAFVAPKNNSTFVIIKAPPSTVPKIFFMQWNEQQSLVEMPEGEARPVVVQTPMDDDLLDFLPPLDEVTVPPVTQSDTEVEDTTIETPVKRPRGRPKKISDTAVLETAPKRLPGRPRKRLSPVPEKSAQSSTSQESELRKKNLAGLAIKDSLASIFSQVADDMYRCNLCKAVKPRRQMISHVRDRHSDLRPHKCQICDKSFKRAFTLSVHALSHDQNKPIYSCDKCTFKTPSRGSFKWHYHRMHTNGHKFTCYHCGRQFKSKHELVAHIATHGEATDMCEICGKLFRGKHLLRAHATTHLYSDEFVCRICKRKLSCQQALDEHAKLHSRVFVCDVCGGRFTTKIGLVKHRNMHTQEKAFPCPVCDKVFATQAIQKVHSILHAGVKPYRCNVCGMGFTQRTPMMMHWRKKHPDETELPPPVLLKNILKSIEDQKKREGRQ